MTDITATAKEYRELRIMIKEMEEAAETLKQQMIGFMDANQHEVYTAGGHIIRYSVYESSRIDTTALKAELPEIAERYTKLSTNTRFQVA